MKDITELKIPSEVYVEEFDINVRPYLTMGEIEAIGDEMIQCPNILLQRLSLMLNVLHICTDIPEEYLNVVNEDGEDNEKFLGFDVMIQSGLWGAVSRIVSDDIDMVWEYVCDAEDYSKAIANFVRNDLTMALESTITILEKWEKKMPRGKQWNELVTNLPDKLKDALEIVKDDGNAEIIKGAMKMGSVAKDDN